MNKIKKFLDNIIYYLLLYGLFILAVVYLIGRVRSWIVFDNYIKTTYGIISNKLKVKYKGRFAGSDVRGYHGAIDRWWVSAYEVKAPFMDKTFEVWVDKRDYTLFGTDFYEVVYNDSKFQHLYSNWVKKQVGIEDENVELKFDVAVKGSRWVGDKPYIEFNKIKTIDSIEEEICENTHNLYLYNVVVDNFNSSNSNVVLSLVKSYEKLLKPYVFGDGDNRLWFGVNLNDLANDKYDPFSYEILFDYNTNEKKYFIYYDNRPVENNKSDYIRFE